MTFIEEGQVGCFREERLAGDTTVGSVVKVRWNEKEWYDARVLFFGKIMISSCNAVQLYNLVADETH